MEGELAARRGLLQNEVNAFLATIAAQDVLALSFDLKPISKYDERYVWVATITYYIP